ncbi:DUF2252 family protein [Streptomyces turgidiscabies]|uniref:DUF2252 family protein n=1 Tax=Streptomyces TaxID=1883 RepID=UPI00076E972A|nr:hypothetical protein T45_08803 [Streptomyces turgidiscabies]
MGLQGIARQETIGPGLLALFGRVRGAPLVRAHTRSGDPVALAACLGGSDRFDRAFAEFAESYADQNERDFEAVDAARHPGRIRAERLRSAVRLSRGRSGGPAHRRVPSLRQLPHLHDTQSQ